MADDAARDEDARRAPVRETAGRPAGPDTGVPPIGPDRPSPDAPPLEPGAALLERIVAAHERGMVARDNDRRDPATPAPGSITRYWWHTAWVTFTVGAIVTALVLARVFG